VPVEDLARPRELCGGPGVKVPVLGEACRGAQRAFLAATADAKGRVRLLDWLRVASCRSQLVVPPGERSSLPRRQQRGQD
jgi:hypothetical protein